MHEYISGLGVNIMLYVETAIFHVGLRESNLDYLESTERNKRNEIISFLHLVYTILVAAATLYVHTCSMFSLLYYLFASMQTKLLACKEIKKYKLLTIGTFFIDAYEHSSLILQTF